MKNENENKKFVSIFEDNWEDSEDWPPEKPEGFLEWFKAKFDKIPDEYKDRACVFLSGEIIDGEPHAAISIHYNRPETEDEIKTRENLQRIIDRQNKEDIDRLVAKHYGPHARIVNKGGNQS